MCAAWRASLQGLLTPDYKQRLGGLPSGHLQALRCGPLCSPFAAQAPSWQPRTAPVFPMPPEPPDFSSQPPTYSSKSNESVTRSAQSLKRPVLFLRCTNEGAALLKAACGRWDKRDRPTSLREASSVSLSSTSACVLWSCALKDASLSMLCRNSSAFWPASASAMTRIDCSRVLRKCKGGPSRVSRPVIGVGIDRINIRPSSAARLPTHCLV